MDIYLLKPADLAKSNHRLLFDVNNRGDKRALIGLNDSTTNTNDPTSAADAGNGFLMRQGYVIAWSGWDATAPPAKNKLHITVPVVKNSDGTPIMGPSLEEFVIENEKVTKGSLTYPAATLDKSKAQLTLRPPYADEPIRVPESGCG